MFLLYLKQANKMIDDALTNHISDDFSHKSSKLRISFQLRSLHGLVIFHQKQSIGQQISTASQIIVYYHHAFILFYLLHDGKNLKG